jgi:hypothetical protein
LPPSEFREWHATVTPDLRNHLIGKLVKVSSKYSKVTRLLLYKLQIWLIYTKSKNKRKK